MDEKELQAAETQQAQADALPEDSGPGRDAADSSSAFVEMTAEQLLGAAEQPLASIDASAANLKAVLEAIVYVLNEPMPPEQIAQALGKTAGEVEPLLRQLAEETARDDRGVFIREVAGGFQMATKPEHHEVIRNFVKNLKQPLKLSQAALETLSVVAYKQPITAPEIIEIRGVQGAGVLKTLLDRKLITTAGRKNVIGKPILYKTTKEFLTQFGLKDLSELPTLKEFEELQRQSIEDGEPAHPELAVAAEEETQELEDRATAAADAVSGSHGASGDEPPQAG
jgi:segregation and condensation protein B